MALPYSAAGFTLFFAEHLDTQDLGNLQHSLAPQVQVFWDAANEHTLDVFRTVKRTHKNRGTERLRVILRLENENLLRPADELREQLNEKQRWSGGGIVGVILGNERDPVGANLRWHKPDGTQPNWGDRPPNGDAHRSTAIEDTVYELRSAAQALKGTGVRLVAPAYSMHGYTEDDPPDPGLFTWREHLAPVTHGKGTPISAHGVHYYDTGWWVHDPSPPDANHQYSPAAWYEYAGRLVGARTATMVNVQRFMHAVRFWSGFHHQPIWWDEANTLNSTMSQVAHMEACVGKSKLLIHHRNPEGYQLGERVEMFSPFVSNGLGNAYPPQYIMRDPACYELVRAHMIEEGYLP